MTNPENYNSDADQKQMIENQLLSLTTAEASEISEETLAQAATYGINSLSESERQQLQLAMINEPGLSQTLIELKNAFEIEVKDREVTTTTPTLKLTADQIPGQNTHERGNRAYVWVTRFTTVALAAAAALSLLVYNMDSLDSTQVKEVIDQNKDDQEIVINEPLSPKQEVPSATTPENTESKIVEFLGKKQDTLRPQTLRPSDQYFDQIPAKPRQSDAGSSAQLKQPSQPNSANQSQQNTQLAQANPVNPMNQQVAITAPQDSNPLDRLTRGERDILLVITMTTSVVLSVVLLLLIVAGRKT